MTALKRKSEIWLSIVVLMLGLVGSGCGDGSSGGRTSGRIDQQGRQFQGQIVGAWKAIDTPQLRFTQVPILGHYILVGSTFTDFVSIYHMFNGGSGNGFSHLDLDGWGFYEAFNGRFDVEFLASRTILAQFFDFNRRYNIGPTMQTVGNGQIRFTLDGFQYTLQRMSPNEMASVFGNSYQSNNVETLLDDLVEHWDLF